MKRLLVFVPLLAVFLSSCNHSGNSSRLPESVTMSKEVLLDKIKGGWAGQTIGCSYGGAELTEQLCATKEPVYLTIDLDCLDPSCFPGTGTPEAGGVSFLQLLDAIRTVSKANIVGADLNELAPMLDISGVSTATACKVLRELLIALDKGWPGFQV